MDWLKGAMDTVKVPALALVAMRQASAARRAAHRQLNGEPGPPCFCLVCGVFMFVVIGWYSLFEVERLLGL
jgi:hypothetical protein